MLNTKCVPGLGHFSFKKRYNDCICPQVGSREFSDKKKEMFMWKCVLYILFFLSQLFVLYRQVTASILTQCVFMSGNVSE